MEDTDEFLSLTQEANNGTQQSDFVQNAYVLHPSKCVAFPICAAGDEVRDQIHGTLSLHPLCKWLMETPQFKRLHRLRQLGLACSVFPSAVHTRLDHSLGVSHLCLEMVQGLQSRQGAELELEERDIRNVAIAGLCHDLGHGPLSHVFEKEFVRRRGLAKWEHEGMSIKMLKYMLEENDVDGVEDEDISFIKQLIKGAKPEVRRQWPVGKRFLFDIVSNDHNGVDMDRADYMQRDALMCGQIQLGCNFRSLMAHARVVDDQICYPEWQMNNVWAVYDERVRLFQQVYTHRRTKAAELMAVDALLFADKALHFSEDIRTAQDFLTLDDSLLPTIEFYPVRHKKAYKLLSGAEQEALVEARRVLRRMATGDMYDCCGEVEIPEQLLLDGTWERVRTEFTPEIVTSYGTGLYDNDVMLDENMIDYGKEGVDPMAKIGFYDGEGDSCRRVDADLSQLPSCHRRKCYKIRTLRVFVREPGKRAAVSTALREWCRERLGSGVDVDTDMLDERDNRYGSNAAAAAARRLNEPLAERQAADPHLAGAASSSPPLPATPATKRPKTGVSTDSA